ncbi:MAG: spherulation-specific family 4 protein, partial [Nitrososphaera sp.]|nr:spherulation-specific family 4 protein [Nitrososphaera sp.]
RDAGRLLALPLLVVLTTTITLAAPSSLPLPSTALSPNSAAAESKIHEDDSFRYDPNDREYYRNLTKFSYVLYYGGFTDQVTEAILAVKPTLLVTNYYAIDPDARREFANNNVSIIAYVPIHWTQRELGSAIEEIERLLDDGADGIFVDEAGTITSDWELWYHGQIFDAVKRFDEDRIVVINPGTASISEDAMLVADIICFEHEWRDIKGLSWSSEYPGWRFMAISSNEFVKVMGYHVNEKSAKEDLEQARHLNIAYHYSADHYIWLPPWLDVYGGLAGAPHPVSSYTPLELEELPRPDDYFPVVDTETEAEGNEYDLTVIQDEPDNSHGSRNNETSGSQEEEQPRADEPEPGEDDQLETGANNSSEATSDIATNNEFNSTEPERIGDATSIQNNATRKEIDEVRTNATSGLDVTIRNQNASSSD